MKTSIISALLGVFPACALAQSSGGYDVPFASEGNALELSVENSSALAARGLTIEAAIFPSWLRFTGTREAIEQLEGRSKGSVVFTFAVDRNAPVRQPAALNFRVSAPNGQSWTKEITIQVSPPQFELFQNYPNPFNPTTIVGYSLPVDGRVSLKIFNLIGQEVATLVDGQRAAGFQQEAWDASSISSGIYIYQLTMRDVAGRETVARKTMILVK